MTLATRRSAALPVALAAGTIALQVCYPLVHGGARDDLTVATVLAFLAASVTHAWSAQGPLWAGRFFGTVIGLSLLVEAVGARSGLPFGSYRYADTLGAQLLGVPVVVPLAWAMFSYPALVVGRRLGHPVLAGAWALASWDLFLDPQEVAARHWRWTDVQVGLPGHVPLSNLLGWVLVSVLLMTLLARFPVAEAADGVPVVLLLWTWVGGIVANAFFFDRPLVALVGGLGMGVVAIPLLR